MTDSDPERQLAEARQRILELEEELAETNRGLMALTMELEQRVDQRTEALRARKADLKEAQRLAHIGSWHWDAKTNVTTGSDELLRIYDFDPATQTMPDFKELRGRCHPVEDWERVNAAMQETLATGIGYEMDVRAFRRGATIWLTMRGGVVRDAHGRIVGLRGTVQDITERKQAEEALRQSQQRFAAIHDRAPFAIGLMRHPDGAITEVNEAWERFFECSREEALGKTSVEVGIASDPDARARMYQEIQEHGSVRDWEMAYRTRSGKDRLAIFNFDLIEISGQKYHLGTALDITERKKAEEALRELNATLEKRVAERTAALEHRARQLQKLTLELSEAEGRERRRLAEILHDDLQQVLAAVKFHLSLLSSRAKHDAAQQTIIAQIDRMLLDAIQKSRNLSHELSPAVLHQGDLGETFTWLAEQMRAKHGLRIAVEAVGPVDTRSEALKTFLYKAGQELLFNVVKHARTEEARVRVRRRSRYLCLSVSDRGRGLDPRELRETAGFGLLSIRERIELLGGRMKIKSARGKGSTFSIVVPDSEEQKRAGTQEVEQLGGPLWPS